MEFLYGYSVAAELRPGTRYDQVVRGARRPRRAGRAPRTTCAPALERAFASGLPALVNVLTDPTRRLPAQVEPGLSARGAPAPTAPTAPRVSRPRPGAARRRRGCRARRPRPARARTRASPRQSRIIPATIVGARSGCRPTTSRRCASVISASRASSSSTRREQQLVAVHAVGVVGVELLVDRGRRGGGAGDGDPALDRRALVLGQVPEEHLRACPRASACSSAGAGGSLWMWRSLMRTTPAGSETWKPAVRPMPTTNSVEPPPMSITTVGSTAAGRPDIAPRNVSCASSSPLSTRASSPKLARARASANSAPLEASRTAEVSTARFASQRCSSIAARYSRQHAPGRARPPPGRACRSRRRRRPRRVTCERRTSSSTVPAPASTSAISSRVEFVPMSTTATRTAEMLEM